MSILRLVKSLRILLTLLVAALWPLVTSHCSLEHMPGLEMLACSDDACAAPNTENECETDGCASVESGLYKSEDGHEMVPTPPLTASASLPAISLESSPPAAISSVVFNCVPPELSKTWRFSLRMALPPRAPSPVS